MADISRDELDRLYQTLDAGFSGVHARLDRMNGRVSANEVQIGILKDRSDAGRAASATWGAIAGAAVAGIAEGLMRWMGAGK